MDYGKLDSGIGTMILILSGIFENNPDISEKECIQYCDSIMTKISISQLPRNPENKRDAYNVFVKQYINGHKSSNSDKAIPDKLFCPAKYTPEGNQLVRKIIGGIFRHFPGKSNPPLS